MNERIVCEASPRIAAAELRVSAILYQAICTALLWAERVWQRRHLARLDARLLDDIGLTATEAETEIDKPFWRA
tara:strand:+ start:252 stop:473 length:222 start_codon:yes stop_codon:yes gene_type:complete